MDKFLFFDLETDRISDGWEEDLPLVTIAGTRVVDPTMDSKYTMLWYGVGKDGCPAPYMGPSDLEGLAKYLWDYTEMGYWVVTWNGAAFDFQLMHTLLEGFPDAQQNVYEVALLHWDIMYQFVKVAGHFLALQTAANGLGVWGKEGVGSDAPGLWKDQKFFEAMKYQAGDVATLERVVMAMLGTEPFGLPWISSSGNANYTVFGEPLSVDRAAELDMPRPHWVTNPPDEHKMVGWLYPEGE